MRLAVRDAQRVRKRVFQAPQQLLAAQLPGLAPQVLLQVLQHLGVVGFGKLLPVPAQLDVEPVGGGIERAALRRSP